MLAPPEREVNRVHLLRHERHAGRQRQVIRREVLKRIVKPWQPSGRQVWRAAAGAGIVGWYEWLRRRMEAAREAAEAACA
jgi:hypothetical protein